MTTEERAQINDLVEWLDNNADGAEDAGALAHNCTRWFPALVSLREQLAEREEAAFKAGHIMTYEALVRENERLRLGPHDEATKPLHVEIERLRADLAATIQDLCNMLAARSRNRAAFAERLERAEGERDKALEWMTLHAVNALQCEAERDTLKATLAAEHPTVEEYCKAEAQIDALRQERDTLKADLRAARVRIAEAWGTLVAGRGEPFIDVFLGELARLTIRERDAARAALAAMTIERDRMIAVAGEALGTDPAMRGPGCIDALAGHVALLVAERDAYQADADQVAQMAIDAARRDDEIRQLREMLAPDGLYGAWEEATEDAARLARERDALKARWERLKKWARTQPSGYVEYYAKVIADLEREKGTDG